MSAADPFCSMLTDPCSNNKQIATFISRPGSTALIQLVTVRGLPYQHCIVRTGRVSLQPTNSKF